MWRDIWRVAATGCCLAAVVAGCGSSGKGGGSSSSSSSGGGGAKGAISLWDETTGGEAVGMKSVIGEFKQQSGITVNERSIDNDSFFTVIRTGMAGNNPPDVLQYEGYQQTRDFAKAGRLMDLTSFWNANKAKFDLPDLAQTACDYQGKVYCIPLNYSRLSLFYNPELLAKHNLKPPATWADFIADAAALKKAGVTPIALGSKDGWPAAHWYYQALAYRCGADEIYKAIDQKGAKWDDPCFVQAGQDVQSLADQGFFPPGVASDDYDAQTALFTAGKAGFMLTGNWFIASWAATPLPFKAGVIDLPAPPGAQHPQDIVGQPIYVVGIPAKSGNHAQAMKFLEALSNTQTARLWSDPGNMSMVKDAVQTSKAPPLIKTLWNDSRQATGSIPFLENELPPAMGEDTIYNGATSLVAKRESPEAFAKSMQAAAVKDQAGA